MHIARNPGIFLVLMRLTIEARFSKAWLEERRGRWTEADPVLEALLTAVEGTEASRTPFFARSLPRAEFHRSPAYRNMVELGFSPEEMQAALSPYRLED